jgi:hypothetical protein
MKRFVSPSFLTLALMFSMVLGHAGTILFTVDEFGNGSFTGFTGSGALPSFIEADPSGGIAGPALVYILPSFPASPVSGDVDLSDPSALAPVTSDVLRFFTDGQGTHFLIFYSDTSDADTNGTFDSGLPTSNPSTNVAFVSEVGTETNNGAQYFPSTSLPGAGNTDFVYQYNFISDSTVPEPTSLVLMAAGLAGLGLKKYLHR